MKKLEDLYHPVQGHPIETIENLDKIPIRDNGELLVNLAEVCPNVLIKPFLQPFHRVQPLVARQAVAERLNVAQQWLDEHYRGYRIVVVDAHRSLAQQRFGYWMFWFSLRLQHPTWPAALIREAANKYVAAPDALTPPPHTTGGAIDVGLLGPNNKRLNLRGPWYKMEAARTDYPHLPSTTKLYRKILCEALTGAGFSNYEEEWWHWSYGDSGWALRENRPYAIYGLISRN